MDFYPFNDEYLRRLRQGDRATEEHFDAYFRPLVRGVLYRRLKNADTVDDVTQETLLQVLTNVKADKVREAERFGSYVLNVAKNLASAEGRRTAKTDQLKPEHDRPGRDERILQKLITGQQIAIINKLLKKLGPRDEALIRELFFYEYTKEEICRRHDVTLDYLRVLMHRALVKLRKMLRKWF
jgi:RNA polymerase sigma-70 factor (ECF subfamily)